MDATLLVCWLLGWFSLPLVVSPEKKPTDDDADVKIGAGKHEQSSLQNEHQKNGDDEPDKSPSGSRGKGPHTFFGSPRGDGSINLCGHTR
jgi:hypothetical protein